MNSFLKRRRGGGLPDQNPFSKGGRAVKFWQWKNIEVGPRSLMLLSHQHLLFEQSKSLLTMVFAYCHSDWQTMKAFIRQAIKHLVCASLHLAWLCGVVLYLCRGCTFPMCHHCVLKPAQYLYLFGARVNCFCCAILCIWRGFVNLHCTALAVWFVFMHSWHYPVPTVTVALWNLLRIYLSVTPLLIQESLYWSCLLKFIL